uniref:Chemokine interleukin-8-like domain-containing protein n=1 Tax=Astyanax mexicanus TaxID=7994 RepID=A0A8B9LEI6_ASTMX
VPILHNIRLPIISTQYCLLHLSQPGDGQHVPVRCVCHKPLKKVQKQLSDLEVYLKRPGCHKDEIIVTVKESGKKVCLSPDGDQGKRILTCWHEMEKTKGDVKQCLKRRRRRPRRKHTRSKKKTL